MWDPHPVSEALAPGTECGAGALGGIRGGRGRAGGALWWDPCPNRGSETQAPRRSHVMTRRRGSTHRGGSSWPTQSGETLPRAAHLRRHGIPALAGRAASAPRPLGPPSPLRGAWRPGRPEQPRPGSHGRGHMAGGTWPAGGCDYSHKGRGSRATLSSDPKQRGSPLGSEKDEDRGASWHRQVPGVWAVKGLHCERPRRRSPIPERLPHLSPGVCAPGAGAGAGAGAARL